MSQRKGEGRWALCCRNFAELQRLQGLIWVIFEPSRVRLLHQPFLVEHEADDRAREVVRVDRAVGAERDQHHRSVNAHLPAGGAIELIERVTFMNMMMMVRACTPS